MTKVGMDRAKAAEVKKTIPSKLGIENHTLFA